jgi:hypothetical protein
VIKRIVLATRACATAEFTTGWRTAAGLGLAAPPDARPLRVAACTVLPAVTPGPPHDGIALEWFTDGAHLARFESWTATPEGRRTGDLLGGVVEPESVHVVVAKEHVLRGEEWLRQRWRNRGTRVKHMAVARRADGLTPAEFADRWRSRAGRVGAVPIPAQARGQAYVQNHPVPAVDGEWLYDAVNEVYFDDLDGLRKRIAWFADNVDEQGEDFIRESWFLAVHEEVL